MGSHMRVNACVLLIGKKVDLQPRYEFEIIRLHAQSRKKKKSTRLIIEGFKKNKMRTLVVAALVCD